ncbi:MAG: rod shape-determining protein MreC [Pseudomonadota bacterium]
MEHSPPPFFKRGPTPFVRLLLCSLLSAALLISDARYQYLDGIRQAVAIVAYPLQRAAAAPAAMLHRVSEFFVTQAALRNEIVRLSEQHLQNGAILQKYRALAAENAHLRELLAMRQRFPESAVAAEVLYSGLDPFTRKIIVDKGSQDDIKAGRPVIDESGVVGQVTRVYPWLAEVTLITDKGQAVPVQNLRNGLRAVLGGTGSDGQLELKFIPLNADFQNGDELVTSGIDGIYPPGLPVAVVANVERNAAYLFARITGKPVAGVSSHGQVLILNWDIKVPERPAEQEKPPRPKKSRRSG